MTRQARFAGVLYVLTIITGMMGAYLPYKKLAEACNLAGAVCYVAVTVILYVLFRPVNRPISLIAALFSLTGCAFGALDSLHRNPTHINNLVFFGVYCLLLGYLIFRSAFMPRWIGALVAIAGVGWLTFLNPAMARSILPLQMVTGLIGEGALTVYLLVGHFGSLNLKNQSAPALPRL